MNPIFRSIIFGVLFLLAGCISDPSEIQSTQNEGESDSGAEDISRDVGAECVPTDCESLGATCGQPDDGCGNPLDCDDISCADGEALMVVVEHSTAESAMVC